MGFVDALLHLLNFVAPALVLGLLAGSLTKWLWWRELAGVPWRRLVVWAGGASLAALVAGLMITGRDGRMVTYGGMVLASAFALWLVAFGPARRR